MKKVLSILGVAFLAQMLFVGMIHFLLIVQGNTNPDTVRSLSDMPVIGGFFFPTPESETPPSEEAMAEIEAQRRLEESRRFFPPPEGMTREEFNDLRKETLGERDRYHRLRNELATREEAIERATEELNQEKALLDATLTELETKASKLESDRAELGERLVSLSQEEAKNLTVMADTLAAMSPVNAARVMEQLEVAAAAKVLVLMETSTSAKILDSWGTGEAGGRLSSVEVIREIKNITSGGGAGR